MLSNCALHYHSMLCDKIGVHQMEHQSSDMMVNKFFIILGVVAVFRIRLSYRLYSYVSICECCECRKVSNFVNVSIMNECKFKALHT